MEAHKSDAPPAVNPAGPAMAAKEAERKQRIDEARRTVWADPQNLRVFAELAKR